MSKTIRAIGVMGAGLVALGLVGCAGFDRGSHARYKSSVVEYLYPEKEVAEVATVPRLSLPLRVGVAFVPPAKDSHGGNSLSEKEQMELMARISSEFRALKFVKDIELIPSAYLKPGGGFTNLDQIKVMYGIDVVALLSYDQVQHTDEGLLSLSYWTIVGAYVVQGEKNDTSTMVDAAVYDIASRKMLFRAPGLSHVKGSATPINLSEQLRKDSAAGFTQASDDLVVNLRAQLDVFQAKVKDMPKEYQIEHKPGYTGGGAIGGVLGLLVLALGACGVWSDARNRKAA